jgi:hypothetical protein
MTDEAPDLPSQHTADRDRELLRLLKRALKDVEQGRAKLIVGTLPKLPRRPTGQ